MNIFQKPYTLRRFGKQTITKGYAGLPYEDETVWLDVQPVSGTDLEAVPEGDRGVKRIKTYGAAKVTAADQDAGIIGDRLCYKGKWFECEASDDWDQSFLAHFESQFVLNPEGEDADGPDEGEGTDP